MTTQQQIQKLRNDMNRKFNKLHTDFSDLKTGIDDKLAPLHDYMIGQQAIAGSNTNSKGQITPKDLIGVILKLVAIIALFVGAEQITK